MVDWVVCPWDFDMQNLFNKYLKILKIRRKKPTLENLTEIVTSHLNNIPFENISKIFYYKRFGLKSIPDFELYLNGIEKNNFGGTCYSNNYYINLLLKHLGFNVILCGADMNNPDVHLTNVINIDSKKYLVDVGYGAPLFNPIPMDIKEVYSINHGFDKYSYFPINEKGLFQIKQFRGNKIKHGYIVKPFERDIKEFEKVIEDSFAPSSTFLNRITIIKFDHTSSVSVRNYSLIKIKDKEVEKVHLANKDEIIKKITTNFNLPRDIVEESVNFIFVR